MLLGKTYAEYGAQLASDSIVVVRGRVSARDDGNALHAQSVAVAELAAAASTVSPLVVTMPEQRATTDTVSALKAVLARHSPALKEELAPVLKSCSRLLEDRPVLQLSDSPAEMYYFLRALYG